MRKKLMWIFLLTAALATSAYGQGGLGSIGGQVKDPSGNAIVGAKVTATNVEKGEKTEAVSTDTGNYQVLQLNPGIYIIEAAASGFKTLRQPDIRVQVADKLTIDLPLEVGEVTDTVTVTSDAPLLRSQDAQQGEVIDQTMIQNLPQLNRDPLRLLVLAGNVQGDGTRAGQDPLSGGVSDTRLNGGRTQGIEYFVDGIAQSTGRSHSVTTLTPSMEAVSEFKVITNGAAAEYGRISGGVVEVVSKGGTNEFHGQAFDYIQNTILNANSWNNNRLGVKRNRFNQNDFGFAVGGPILLPRFGEGGPAIWSGKNRSFFFFNYEGVRFVEAGAPVLSNVPTELERRGDFSQTRFGNFRTRLYDPDSPQVRYVGPDPLIPGSRLDIFERTQLLNGNGLSVPANRIHPLATAYLTLVPLPNRAPSADCSYCENHIGFRNTKRNTDAYAVRLDHSFTENNRIFGRYQHNKFQSANTRFRGIANTANESVVPGAYGATINYDWTISPTLIFNARVGGHYNPYEVGNRYAPEYSNSLLPVPSDVVPFLADDVAPWITNAGNYTLTDSPDFRTVNSTTFNTSAAMTKVLSRHTLKGGYEHRRYYDNFFNSGFVRYRTTGNSFMQYTDDYTAGSNPRFGQQAANSLAAFLLGINNRADAQGSINRTTNVNYNGAYIQDDWKVTPKLTLNLGVRWDLEGPTTDRFDRLYFWDPEAPSPFTINPGWTWEGALRARGIDPATVRTPSWVTNGLPKGAVRIANTAEHPDRSAINSNYWQFGPRIGAAFAPNDRTVIRGFVGKVYLSTTGDPNGFGRSGLNVALSDQGTTGWHPAPPGFATHRYLTSSFSNPFRAGDVTTYARANSVANVQSSGQDGVTAFNSDSHQPYEWVWNAGIQRELPGGIVAEAIYSANRGVDLLGRDQISRFPRDLYVPQNRGLYSSTTIENPFGGQTRGTQRGDQIALGILEHEYPYFGPVLLLGSNVGRSNYQSLNLRMEKRLSRSYSFLLNYTLSKLLDNVGGPNADGQGIAAGGGVGSKARQQVDTVDDLYGLSPLDERHVVSVTYYAELPFGRGRRFLGDTGGFGRTVLDYVVGGWELSGISRLRSGRPVIIPQANFDNTIRIESTYLRLNDGFDSVANPNFSGRENAFFSSSSPVPSSDVGLFNRAAIGGGNFTYGNLHLIEDLRHPGSVTHDLSLLKRFPIFGENRYLQFRMEANNILNMRGYANYETNPSNVRFGTITRERYDPRRIQMSLRFVF